MSQPSFVAKPQNGEYVFVRSDTSSQLTRVMATGAGALLLMAGARGRGLASAIGLAAGAALTYHGLTGRNIEELWRSNRTQPAAPVDTPSYLNRTSSASTQTPEDRLEEAQMESFPASDPPASHRST